MERMGLRHIVSGIITQLKCAWLHLRVDSKIVTWLVVWLVWNWLTTVESSSDVIVLYDFSFVHYSGQRWCPWHIRLSGCWLGLCWQPFLLHPSSSLVIPPQIMGNSVCEWVCVCVCVCFVLLMCLCVCACMHASVCIVGVRRELAHQFACICMITNLSFFDKK